MILAEKGDYSEMYRKFFKKSFEFHLGPLPRNTSLDLESVITKSIGRILTAFDDVVQVGLVRLRLGEISQIATY